MHVTSSWLRRTGYSTAWSRTVSTTGTYDGAVSTCDINDVMREHFSRLPPVTKVERVVPGNGALLLCMNKKLRFEQLPLRLGGNTETLPLVLGPLTVILIMSLGARGRRFYRDTRRARRTLPYVQSVVAEDCREDVRLIHKPTTSDYSSNICIHNFRSRHSIAQDSFRSRHRPRLPAVGSSSMRV